jgi:hypothetical protein
MKTISYDEDEWKWDVWNRLAKDHSALSMGKALGFTLRKQVEMMVMDDAPAGYERITIHLDFERDEDYTMFLLKYR